MRWRTTWKILNDYVDGNLPTAVAESALRELLDGIEDELLVKDFDFLARQKQKSRRNRLAKLKLGFAHAHNNTQRTRTSIFCPFIVW